MNTACLACPEHQVHSSAGHLTRNMKTRLLCWDGWSNPEEKMRKFKSRYAYNNP